MFIQILLESWSGKKDESVKDLIFDKRVILQIF